jgi:hypothetical protein
LDHEPQEIKPMTIEENFRFDTRIQARMLKKGEVSPGELEQRLAALPDREADAMVLDLAQPASIAEDDE